MNNTLAQKDYYLWLRDILDDDWPNKPNGEYLQLFQYLKETDYYWSIALDEDRATNGIELRYIWGGQNDLSDEEVQSIFRNKRCSVLEMLIAMCVDVENKIMLDQETGFQASRWFWLIIDNLGLISMSDDLFDYNYVEKSIDIMLNRSYDSDGRNGGPFIVDNPKQDLRQTNYWMQFMWFLASLYE